MILVVLFSNICVNSFSSALCPLIASFCFVLLLLFCSLFVCLFSCLLVVFKGKEERKRKYLLKDIDWEGGNTKTDMSSVRV